MPDNPLRALHETIYDAFEAARADTTGFDPSTSPLFGHVGFVVGAPRSGTTWLQQLLYAHPLVATGGESHLFCEVLPPAFENFRLPDPTANVGSWVSEGQLLSIARSFCDSVFLAARDRTRPGAQLVVEKTPNHRMQSALQAQIYPDARYVHIIRDGRDATASQRVNWSSLAKDFAHAGAMAKAWAAEVRDIRTHFGALAYLELRYEDIVRDTPGALAAIFDHFGLPHDRALCEDAAAFGKAPVNTYLGSFDVGVRKHQGDALAERSVARAAGDLLTELGYADAEEIARLRRLRTRATMVADARDAVATAAERGLDLWGRGVKKVRVRARRRVNAPGRALAGQFISAVSANDPAALADIFAPRLSVDAQPVPDADAAARALLERIGGSRAARHTVFGGLAQITFVTVDDERCVVRLKPENGRVAEVSVSAR